MLKGMVLYLQNKVHSVNDRGQLLIVLCVNGAPATEVFTIPGFVSWNTCLVLWVFFFVLLVCFLRQLFSV